MTVATGVRYMLIALCPAISLFTSVRGAPDPSPIHHIRRRRGQREVASAPIHSTSSQPAPHTHFSVDPRRSPSPTTRGTWRCTHLAWGPAARTPSAIRSSTSSTTGMGSATSRCGSSRARSASSPGAAPMTSSRHRGRCSRSTSSASASIFSCAKLKCEV